MVMIGRHDDTVVFILFADLGKNVFGRIYRCHCSVYVGLGGIRKRKRWFYDVRLVGALVFLQQTECSCGVLTTLQLMEITLDQERDSDQYIHHS